MPKCSLCGAKFIGDQCPECGKRIGRTCNHESQNFDGNAEQEDRGLFRWTPSASDRDSSAENLHHTKTDPPPKRTAPPADLGAFIGSRPGNPPTSERPQAPTGEFRQFSSPSTPKKARASILLAFVCFFLIGGFVTIVFSFIFFDRTPFGAASPDSWEVSYSYSEPAVEPPASLVEYTYQLVGEDVAPGIYYLSSENDYGYFEICSDDSGLEDSIIYNDSFPKNYYIELEEGQYLYLGEEVDLIPLAEAPKPPVPQDNILPAGMYLIGRDLPEGSYTIESTSEEWEAFVWIANDCRADWNNAVLAELFFGALNIEVTEGQYLYVDDGQIRITSVNGA